MFDTLFFKSVPGLYINLFLVTVGTLYIAAHLYDALKLAAQLLFLKGTSLKKYGAGKGAWAAITGPTGDIGLAFSRQLAQKGFNIVLVGRNASKLAELSLELRQKYNVQTRGVVVDFNHPSEEAFAELKQIAEELEIGVLINNAGVSHEMPVYFSETSSSELNSILDVNIKSTLLATQSILPSMLARKRGLVLTLGSFSALVPSAMLATYSGSKSFLERWSQALGEETKEFGVDVQLVVPYFVVSSMSKIRKPSLLIPTAPDFVRSTLSSLGQSRGAGPRVYTSTPYWSHAMFDYVLRVTGLGGAFAISKGLAMHKDIRRRALKKKEREAKAQ